MEFYDLLSVIKLKEQDLWWVPVDGYFKSGDKLSVSFQGEVIILKKKSSDGVSELLSRKNKLVEVRKDANGLWVLLPEWIVGLLSAKVEYFAVALDDNNFSGATPDSIALKPIKGKSVTLEAQKPKLKELQVIDVNRGRKVMDISATVAKVPSDGPSLSEEMLQAAFGADPDFDPSLGTPKVVR